MVTIRRFLVEDLTQIQECNLYSLPENYQLKYYYYHYISWPQLSWVAVDEKEKVIGYVLVKMEDEEAPTKHGHITSLAVSKKYRKLGIAEKLMKQAELSVLSAYGANHITLHVRKSNLAAFSLYKDRLGFSVVDVDEKYYADGEDAYSMKKIISL